MYAITDFSLSFFFFFVSTIWDCRGRNCMVVGFTTTYAISVYHHYSCEFEFTHGDVN